jgi:hypothetical protein
MDGSKPVHELAFGTAFLLYRLSAQRACTITAALSNMLASDSLNYLPISVPAAYPT